MPGMIYIFDVDGTLVPDMGCELYPHVIDWLKGFDIRDRLYIATNQGGVGLRYWMESTRFAKPGKDLPTQLEAVQRIDNVAKKVSFIAGQKCIPFISFAYQSKSGNWSPRPSRGYFHEQRYLKYPEYAGSWDTKWRKPGSGMLDAIRRSLPNYIEKRRFVFVGNAVTDEQAAEAAGIGFEYAQEFFSQKEGMKNG